MVFDMSAAVSSYFLVILTGVLGVIYYITRKILGHDTREPPSLRSRFLSSVTL
jgi:hypothetical protein